MRVTRILIFVLLAATFAGAQATRTWVSGVGDDANPCSRTAPCKTFAGAISKTAPGGEIDALDPGGFGALTITKSITIDGGGGQVASVLVAGTNGVVVAAGTTDVIILRNIRFDGLRGGGNANAGLSGIRFISGLDLVIENCVIFGFNNNAIDIANNQNSNVTVINTNTENNGLVGLRATTSAGTVKVTITGSTFTMGTHGVQADGASVVSVTDSVAANNSSVGFLSQAVANGATAVMDVVRSTSSSNAVGMQAGGSLGSGFLRIGQNALYENSSSGISVSTNGSCTTFTQGGAGTNINQGAHPGPACGTQATE